MKKFATCKTCQDKGRPNGFHSVSIDENKVEVHCSTCGELVVSFVLSDKIKEELDENKVGTGTISEVA